MSTKEEINNYLKKLKEKFKKEMPRISNEIKVYEKKVAEGSLSKNPNPGPQFNG